MVAAVQRQLLLWQRRLAWGITVWWIWMWARQQHQVWQQACLLLLVVGVIHMHSAADPAPLAGRMRPSSSSSRVPASSSSSSVPRATLLLLRALCVALVVLLVLSAATATWCRLQGGPSRV